MRLRRLLREVPLPDEHEARQRSLAVVRAAYAAREPVPRRRTAYLKPDGRQGGGRYTDVWTRQNGRWLAVSAHVTRL